MPLCDGVHLQGYIVNIKEHKIIHIDSLRWDQLKNLTSIKIAKMLFENSQPTLNLFFRKEDSLMLTAVVYDLWLECLRINKSSRNFRQTQCDIAYNLLEQNPIIQKVESLSPHFSTEDQLKQIVSEDF